jgi:peptide/nickel transport system substrate-binding protein
MAAGCGGDEDDTTPGGLPRSGGSGMLVYALPGLPETLDPLAADSPAAQVVSRQVHEPLVSRVRPPYGGAAGPAGPQPGLALSVEPSDGGTVWRVTLRQDVRFQDGSPFNASAVLANTRRWTETGSARELLPGLFAVDAPRPDEVRFLFADSQPDVPRLLAAARLGIVSARALADAAGERSAAVDLPPDSGTGAFALGERSDERLLLTRNAEWWGTSIGLGPALDGLEFVRVPSSAERLEAVASGAAQVAEPLDSAEVSAARAETLVRVVSLSAPAGPAAVEASVRGLAAGPGEVPELSGVWLTRIGA